MQSYVKKREPSPSVQNGQPKIDRRAVGAQAKVPMPKGRPVVGRQGNDQALTGLPARGFGNAANISASVTKQEPTIQPIKVDQYDTDAESIDTTVNQSIIQPLENARQSVSRPEAPDHVADSFPPSDEFDEDDDELWDEADKYAFTNEEVAFLEARGQHHLGRADAIAYLNAHRGMTLPVVDGDSYPNTTEGDPTEAETVKDENLSASEDVRSASPSPQRMPAGAQKASALQTGPVRIWKEGRTHNMPGRSSMFQKAQNVRDQRFVQPQFELPQRHTANNAAANVPSSQPPSYSQAQVNNNEGVVEQVQIRRRQREHTPNPTGRVNFQPSAATTASAPAHKSATPAIELISSDEPHIRHPDPGPAIDYNHKTLLDMSYNELKNQSFDDDPLAKASVLTEDLVDRPLPQRLEFVHRNLDAEKQATFFASLPTNDWEDAGDWFLDQFNTIIHRTKEARQKKRKLAKAFEDEVAKRHKHVAKKQHQVEEAMEKMKAQGEGMIPKTPRSGRSPRGRKN